MKDELKAHTIILPSYCPVAICLTKEIAQNLATSRGYKDYRLEVTTQQDVKCLLGNISELKNA